MTRRDLFQRLIGAPLAAAGALFTQQSQRFPRAIVYWTETFCADGSRFLRNTPSRKFYVTDPAAIRKIIGQRHPSIVFSQDGRTFWKTFIEWRVVPAGKR